MKRRGRFGLIAAVVIVIVAAAYTGLWFYLADALEHRANAFIAGLTGRSIKAACVDMDVGGYPLGIGLSCKSIDAADQRNGSAVAAGAFRSTTRLTHPGYVVSALDGPLTASAPGGYGIKAGWSTLGSNAQFWRKGLSHGDMKVAQFNAAVTAPQLPGTLTVTSPAMEARTSQQQEDLDIAFSADQLALKGPGRFSELPVADVSGTATLGGMAKLLRPHGRLADHPLRGKSGTLRSLTAKLADGASVTVTGPFSFDAQGRLSGTFRIAVTGLDKWQETADRILPKAREAIANAGRMLSALTGGTGTANLTLTADHGRLAVGFIPLGKLPPL